MAQTSNQKKTSNSKTTTQKKGSTPRKKTRQGTSKKTPQEAKTELRNGGGSRQKWLKIDPFYEPKNKDEFHFCLKSRLWRLHNLYTIKNKEAELVKFVPKREQLELLHNMHNRNVILKARQLGVSTFWLIYMLDSVLFYPGVETGCIAHTREDAAELFENKVKLAFDMLPEEIQTMHKQVSDRSNKLAFSNGSSIRIGTSFRSGTPVIVLISEFGYISAKMPEQAREIESGTFNAVPANGILVVESTAMGNEGSYYNMVEQARRHAASSQRLTAYDFKFFFFSWIDAEEYWMDPEGIEIPQELKEYFEKIENETGKSIPDYKRAWYTVKSNYKISAEMKREYPSTPEEAFETSIEGSYFYNEMFDVRKNGRMSPTLKADPNQLVDTAWDIGFRDSMAITWFQVVSPTEVLILDYYENTGENFGHYVEVLEQKRIKHGFQYGAHYGPHDIGQHSVQTGQTLQDWARGFGINFTPLPKARAKQDLIECARRIIPYCWFKQDTTQQLIRCLDHHRKEWKMHTGTYSDKPRHDWTSNGADSFKYMAYAVENFGGSRGRMTPERIKQIRDKVLPPAI